MTSNESEQQPIWCMCGAVEGAPTCGRCDGQAAAEAARESAPAPGQGIPVEPPF